jgi:hypothetical protein
MFRQQFDLRIWDVRVGVEATETEVVLGIPLSLHQLFEHRDLPLQLVTKGEKAAPFGFNHEYEEEKQRYLWHARIPLNTRENFSLMMRENCYATWKRDEHEGIKLVYRKER